MALVSRETVTRAEYAVIAGPQIHASSHASLTAAIATIGSTEADLLISNTTTCTANTTVPSNIRLIVTRQGRINQGTYTLTINGPFEAGLSQVFTGTGAVTFGRPAKDLLPEWWGAIADSTGTGTNGTDNTTALQKAATSAGTTHRLRLSTGTYRVTSAAGSYALTVACPIIGNSPSKSVIYNSGTGSALLIDDANYYERWENFSVVGNANSQNGIATSIIGTGFVNVTAYCHFAHVDSHNHGAHGLIHRNSWATKYFDCKFYENGMLGILCWSVPGDDGVANNVWFLLCESRRNGGSATGTTHADDRGGVKIVGGAGVYFYGGVYEFNNAWSFIISNQTDIGTTNVHLDGLYCEYAPSYATTGGFLYAAGVWSELSVTRCWIALNAGAGRTDYVFNINRVSEDQVFTESQNTIALFGAGTHNKFSGNSCAQAKYFSMKNIFGDVTNTGSPVTIDLATISNDGLWIIRGDIVVSRNTTAAKAIYPFVVARESTGTRTVGVGMSPKIGAISKLVLTVTNPPTQAEVQAIADKVDEILTSTDLLPTMAFNGNVLQLTFPAHHTGYVVVNDIIAYNVGSMPATLQWNPTYFLEGNRMRR